MKIPDLTLKSISNELDQSSDFKRELFEFIINFIDSGVVEYHLLPQLYSPDFILRARAIMKIKENNDTRYIKFLLPLLDDPDDSVRWSVIKYLTQFKNDPTIYGELKIHLEKELNPIISSNLKEIFE
jgi:HEAT repeat protein